MWFPLHFSHLDVTIFWEIYLFTSNIPFYSATQACQDILSFLKVFCNVASSVCLQSKKSPWQDLQPELLFFISLQLSASFLCSHILEIILLLWIILSRDLGLCMLCAPLQSVCLYLCLAPDCVHCSELNQELFLLISVFWLAVPRRYRRVSKSHLMPLYCFTAYVDNMMECDAVAECLNWYSFSTAYISESISELVTP